MRKSPGKEKRELQVNTPSSDREKKGRVCVSVYVCVITLTRSRNEWRDLFPS